mgnify:CR=1 FL=1
MTRLTLVRHGHAAPESDAGDFARKLDARGLSEARHCGERLHALHYRPGSVLASPAKRTQRTALELLTALELPESSLQLEPRLYLADRRSLREIVATTDTSIHHLLIVGHNPGLSDFAAELCDEPIEALVTGAFCSLQFDATAWREVVHATARQWHQESPSARRT